MTPPLLILVYLLTGIYTSSCSKEETFKESDYWISKSPESQLLDPLIIDKMEKEVSKLEDIYSFLVIRNGYLIEEKYYNGKDKSSLLHIRSITKTIIGLLTGIAIDNGTINNTDEKITKFIPELKGVGAWDQVKIYHLLNMLSGMKWNEDDDILPWLDNIYSPLEFYKSRGNIMNPGNEFNYNTSAVHLLSLVLSRASGISVESMAIESIFNPLEISKWSWERDKSKNPRGGTGLSLRARDLAKLGQLFLQDGMWIDDHIVSETWVKESWYNPIDLAQFNTNYNLDFRNQWWSHEFQGYEMKYSEGYGGQFLAIIPELELIMIVNRKSFTSFENAASRRSEFFKTLLPSLLKAIKQ